MGERPKVARTGWRETLNDQSGVAAPEIGLSVTDD